MAEVSKNSSSFYCVVSRSDELTEQQRFMSCHSVETLMFTIKAKTALGFYPIGAVSYFPQDELETG